MRRAFSLVELSIVLVILGLLVGGILAGQSLIRASELRSISSDFTKYETATLAFRDKYFGLPGDLLNAASLWPTTYSGNGDGAVDMDVFVNSGTESTRSWVHLQSAGLVEGQLSGTNWPNRPGINLPTPKSSPNAGYSIFSGTSWSNGPIRSRAKIGLEGAYSPNATQYLLDGVMTPAEAWNLDTKMDDGNPGQGRLNVKFRMNAAGSSVLSDCTTPAGHSLIPTAFALDVTDKTCRLYYWMSL